VSVRVLDVRNRARVFDGGASIGEFTKWLERRGGTPAEITRKGKVREILSLPQP